MHAELLDILDCTGRKTGAVMPRDEVHHVGAWHAAFHCLIVFQRDGVGCVLFQRRAEEKLIAPGRFDVSVGGHYAAGESAETAAPREIKEELGIDVRFGDLFPIGRRVFVYCFTPGVLEYEFQDIFLLPIHVRPEGLVLQHGEVDAVLEMEISNGIALFSGRSAGASARLFGRNGMAEIEVRTDDFVQNPDNYYLKLLLIAGRYLMGRREDLVI